MGADVVALPTISISAPPDDVAIRTALAELSTFSWLIFTSANAVERFWGYLTDAQVLQLPPTTKVAVVGAPTASALRARGVEPSLIPSDYRAEGLIEQFDRIGPAPAGARVLIPRALSAREILPEHLAGLGYDVVVAPVYETVPAPRRRGDLDVLSEAAGVTFTSPTTARFLWEGCREAGVDPAELLANAYLFSIGPVTTEALVELGANPERIVEADRSAADDLARAVRRTLAPSA